MRRIPLSFLLLGVLAQTGLAWGPVGHKTVALIAWSRLDDATKSKIIALLGPKVYLDQLAICPDIIKHQPYNCAHAIMLPQMPQTGGWHFIDIPTKDAPSGGNLGAYCGGSGGCVVDAIGTQMRILKAADASVLDKEEALMFLVHLVGDEHQPLHCAYEVDADGVSDRGGNEKPIHFADNYAGKRASNLHQLWDGLVAAPGELKKVNPFDLAKELEGDLEGKDTAGWIQGDFTAGAAVESFQLSKTLIYPAYAQDQGSISRAYLDRMQPIVYERLERAGVRLAALLEEAFKNPN